VLGWLNYHKKSPSQPAVNIVWPAAEPPSASALTIASADLHVSKHPDRVLLIIPAGTTWWYEVSAVVRSAPQTAFGNCAGGYEYALAGRQSGLGTLFAGSSADWYDGHAHQLFGLSQGGGSEQQFYFQGPAEKPSSLRLKIICRQPHLEVSPWYNVDLANAVGW
jgi:hypothetical protein